MTSLSKSANACGVQSEGENIDEVSVTVPSYFASECRGAFVYLGAANERNRRLRPLPLHSSYDAPAVI